MEKKKTKDFDWYIFLCITCYALCKSREKSERGHNGPKPVTANCCRALPPSEEVDVNYIHLYPSFCGKLLMEIDIRNR